MPRLHELVEKRANAVTAMRALADLAERETRDLNGDEEKRYGDLKVEIAGLDKKIERAKELETLERAAPAIVNRRGDGTYEARAREFSIVHAIRASLPRDLGGGDIDAGLERELSAEVAKRTGRTFEGIAVPDEVFLAERRTITIGGGTGEYLAPSTFRPDLFIDRLRAALVTERLGATVLNNLVGGAIDIPRQTGSSSAQWVGEEGTIDETDATFGDIAMYPRTVGARTSYSRRMILNSSPAVEQIVRNDLAAIIASAIDEKAMLGTGASNVPTGIVNENNVFEIDCSGGINWDLVLSFIASIENANAASGRLGWAMNAWAQKRLRAGLKAEQAWLGWIMENPGDLAGYPAAITSALPGDDPSVETPAPATMIFGDWSSLLIGYWSGIDILVNPYESTAYSKGRVLVRAMRDIDVQIRHPESFAFTDNMPTTQPES